MNVPVVLSSTYAQKDIGTLTSHFDYSRCGNPTREALEECLTALEYGVGAITFSSGCGATATLLHTLQSGDHVICCDDVYGGTQRYMRRFFNEKHGMEAEFVDISDAQNVMKAIKKNTKFVWIESPTNPTMKVIDIKTICEGVRAINPDIKVIADNTFSSPFISSPLLLGADVAYHSLTKYGAGHSDLVMGALVFKDAEYRKQVFFAAYTLGACPSAFDCYLCLRSLKTLELRILAATRNAYHVAHFLEKHPAVENVIYAGLKSHKSHEIARKQMRGFGGMLSFRVKGGKEQASKFLKALKVFTLAESLGGVESLAQVPFFMTHGSVPLEVRKQLEITENLIRLSVGIEDMDDLIADVSNGLEASQK